MFLQGVYVLIPWGIKFIPAFTNVTCELEKGDRCTMQRILANKKVQIYDNVDLLNCYYILLCKGTKSVKMFMLLLN